MLAIRVLGRLSAAPHIGLYVPVLALCLAAVFCFVVYPLVESPYTAVLDPDHYGGLGYGLWKHHTLSYFPDDQPTLNRGPAYPLFIAGLLAMTGGWWPRCVQAGQCVAFASTCGIVFWTASRLWNRQLGLLAAMATAMHPFLVWYTSRIWIETFGTFLFSAVVASTVSLRLKPSLPRSVLAGLIVGASCLCKATFLPLALAVPLLLRSRRASTVSWVASLVVLATAAGVVTPWTVRNWRLSGRLVPVHLLAGVNFSIGDSYAQDYPTSGWSTATLRPIATARRDALLAAEMPSGLTRRWEVEVATNSILLRHSVARYLQHPLFFSRKLAVNAWMFWTLGETPAKTLVISMLQLPLLGLFAWSGWRAVTRKELLGTRGIPLILTLLYFVSHLPIYAVARFSVILVPTMLVSSVGNLERWLPGEDTPRPLPHPGRSR